MYRYINKNPHNNHISDCVVRCLSILTNRSWRSIYDELSDLAGDAGLMLSDVTFVEDYLDDRYNRECHYSKTVGAFAQEHPKGKYAVTMNNHITAIIDGIVYDTFDPRDRIMRCAWRVD